jgi:hypothetical protein
MKLPYFLTFLLIFNSVEAISMPTAASVKSALLSSKVALISKATLAVGIIGYLVNDLRVIGTALYEGQDGARKLKRSELTAEPFEEFLNNIFFGGYYPACITPETKKHWRHVHSAHGWKYYLNSDHCWYILDEQGNRIHPKHLTPDEKISEMQEVLIFLNDPRLDLNDSMYAELAECKNNPAAIDILFDQFLSRRDKIIADARREFQLRALRDIAILGGLAILSTKKILKRS